MSKSIAIVGAGVICSIGTDKCHVIDSLKNRRSGIGEITHLPSTHHELPVGEVNLSNEEMKAMLGVKGDKEISRTVLLGTIAIKEAIKEAGLTKHILQGKKVVLISGTTVGGMDVTERHFSQMLVDDKEAGYIVNHECGRVTSQIAELCDLECELVTISTACSSALNAIILGTKMLLLNQVDYVLAGGCEALSSFHLNGFNSLLILDKEPCKPFDAKRNGLNLGEGAAYVCLQRSEDANASKILGYIGGYGNRCDAFHQTATSPDGEGAFLAMKDALEMSGLSISDINYVNAHGTGTPDNDQSESKALIRLFGNNLPPISSTKSFTGQTTSASGSIETVISLLANENGFIPANLRYVNKDVNCIEPSLGTDNTPIRNVLCNSFGFGGNDSAVILTSEECELICPHMVDNSILLADDEIHSVDDLAELCNFVPKIEVRRMSKLMKAALLTTMRTLLKAGVERPDAIIIGTRFGMLEQGEKILLQLHENGEEGVSPTLFMQSTHNTIAGALAIRLKCKGYNITFSQGEDSLCLAIEDAKRLISEGKACYVLVGIHDYCPELFRSLYKESIGQETDEIYSRSILIAKKA